MGKNQTSFQPGQSGNPAGRPVGKVAQITRYLKECASKVAPLLLERALKGDFESQKLLMQLAIPKPRSFTCEPEPEIERKRVSILRALRKGKVTATEAAIDLSILGIEMPDFLKVLLSKEEDSTPDNLPYCIFSSEEMEKQKAEREANLKYQKEVWLPQRRKEIQELYKEMESNDSFAPDAQPQERTED